MAGKKELIMAAAKRLLEQRNYREISVLDIVAESNVNRNTFYYHFKDMPALVESLACRCVDRVFDEAQLSLEEKLRTLVDTLYENRQIATHVCDYADRAVFDAGLDRVCAYLMERIAQCSSKLLNYSEDEKKCVLTMGKACLFGLCSDWLMSGVSEERREMLYYVIAASTNRLK